MKRWQKATVAGAAVVGIGLIIWKLIPVLGKVGLASVLFVVTKDGTTPLPGATVTLPGVGGPLTTNVDGKAQYGGGTIGAPPGTYTWTVTATGYSTHTGQVTVTAGQQSIVRVNMGV